MNEQIKLTEDDLKEIKNVQDSFQQKILQFGQLQLQKIQIEDATKNVIQQESILKTEWLSLQKLENDLLDKLLSKYGEGSLDLSKGIFISEKKS